jgi:hypothetical protein
MQRKFPVVLSMVLVLLLLLPLAARAASVGRFTMVVGQVDLLRQGKLPAVPVKVQDTVAAGDVIRTKSKSKAQVKFVDDTTLTLAPESRVAIADYVYDPARNQRRAVLRIFRGLVHTVVTRILDLQEPDFILQSFTAVIGVRGTNWYSLIKPNSTLVALIGGGLQVGSSNLTIPGVLLLKDLESTEVFRDQFPRPKRLLTPADVKLFQKLMETGVLDFSSLEAPPGGEGAPVMVPGSPESLMPPTIPPVPSKPPEHGPKGESFRTIRYFP